MPLRKISLTCLETILDTTPERMDAAALVQVMPVVLADKDELKTQAHQVAFCVSCAGSIILVRFNFTFI